MAWTEDNFLERLMPHLRRENGVQIGPCPDSELLSAFMDGQVSPVVRDSIASHLTQCQKCHEVCERLGQFAKASVPAQDEEWINAEKRLDNWMSGFLLTQSDKTASKLPVESSTPVPRWKEISRTALSWKLGWALGMATVLALGVAGVVLTSRGPDRSSPVQIAKNQVPPPTRPADHAPSVSENSAQASDSANRSAEVSKSEQQHSAIRSDMPSRNPPPKAPSQIATLGKPQAAGPRSRSSGTNSIDTSLTAQNNGPPPLQSKHTALAESHTTTSSYGGHTAAGGHWTAGGHTAFGSLAAGGHTAASRGNFRWPAGTRNVSLKGGGHASVRANGSVRSADRNGHHVERGLHGGRTSTHDRGHGERVFAGRHGGYVQHPYMVRGGRSFYSRTYVVGGVMHVGIYQGYFWGGRAYYSFYPGFFYAPAFYGWATQPWGVPVAWGVSAWGWGGPWWGFYGGWFTPYPVYAAPYFWQTDYLIAANLQTAYAAAHEPPAAGEAAWTDPASTDTASLTTTTSAPVTLSPEVKQAIAEEVRALLAAQQALAAQGGASGAQALVSPRGQIPPALDPEHRTFVVDTTVTALANGQECGLTSGDVVTRLTDTPDATDNTVNASVSASKRGDCAAGVTVAIKVDDLQEMYNHFQEQLTDGLAELAKRQGRNGMPKAPDTKTTASDVPTPTADPDAAKAINDENAEADEVEADVKAEAAAGGGGFQ